ncbi:MAG: phytanoyl-CoA dioxygenase family protein [Polyangiaceae bacterium]
MMQTQPTNAAPSRPASTSARPSEILPITTRFELGAEITPEQHAFLDHYGFIIFSQVAKPDEVERIAEELNQIEAKWLAEGRKEVYGIPIFRGKGSEGQPFLQRLPFTSCFSEYLHGFLRDPHFDPVRRMIGEQTHVGDHEMDGLVANRNLNVPGSAYPRLGWHTDGLRDLFYLRMPKRMLNVGLHLDRVQREDGGLRVIPGSHKQGPLGFLFRKVYFLSHGEDAHEVAIETQPGDLTLHDGRTWHRVEQSPHTGPRSLRRTLYFPFLTEQFPIKDEQSKTPLYHYLGRALRAGKRVTSRIKR